MCSTLFFLPKKQINTKPGPLNQVRPVYEKMPFYFNFIVRIFNVTNKEDVIQGSECLFVNEFSTVKIVLINFMRFVGKPNLQEVGPYFFE